MSDEVSTYRKIIKSGSLFGIVQIVNIIIAIVRSKILAILIGPAGYGVFGLLNSTIDMVRMATGFGLETSSVKNIAEIPVQETQKLKAKASVVVRLGIITGCLGAVLAIVFSKYLSIWTFKDSSMGTAIIIIAASVLFQQVANSQIAVMQGMGKLAYLAKTNLYGNLAGLVLTLPVYYYFKVDAIVPAIVLTAAINLAISAIYYKKLNTGFERGGIKKTIAEGREILYFGFLLSLSAFLPVLSNYLIQIFISNTSTLATVGIFTIGMAMVNSYVGILFTAMSAEYYPRLATLVKDKIGTASAVNQQAIIAMLAIVPIIIFFQGFSPYIVKILLSPKFIAVIPMLLWAVTAMFFKAVSFSMGYVIIARGDSKVFIKTAIVFNSLYILFCITGFYWGALQGLGIGLLLYYALHLMAMAVITKVRYGIKTEPQLIKIFVVGLAICVIGMLISHVDEGWVKNIIFLILLLLSLIYSLKEIDRRVRLKLLMKDYIKKKTS